jgi:hypothetical protein
VDLNAATEGWVGEVFSALVFVFAAGAPGGIGEDEVEGFLEEVVLEVLEGRGKEVR